MLRSNTKPSSRLRATPSDCRIESLKLSSLCKGARLANRDRGFRGVHCVAHLDGRMGDYAITKDRLVMLVCGC